MKHRIVFVLAAALLPPFAAGQDAQKYQCTYGELQRRVEIAHEPGVEVPCSVHYFKDTENPGEQQVLWTAESDPGFCRTKTLEFVTKLEGWGWDCGRGDDEPVEPIEESEAPEGDVPDEMLGDPDAAEPANDPESD